MATKGLGGFGFEIQYKLGSETRVADALYGVMGYKAISMISNQDIPIGGNLTRCVADRTFAGLGAGSILSPPLQGVQGLLVL